MLTQLLTELIVVDTLEKLNGIREKLMSIKYLGEYMLLLDIHKLYFKKYTQLYNEKRYMDLIK